MTPTTPEVVWSMFKRLGSKRRSEEVLIDLIAERGAEHVASGGKFQTEAEYLALWSVVDEMSGRSYRVSRARAFIGLMSTRYPYHREEVMIYMAWKTGVIDLGKEREAAILARHGPWATP